jgi:hypothetical protein
MSSPSQGAIPTDGRVAVITDIHGNLPALHAALARIDEPRNDDDAIARDLEDCGYITAHDRELGRQSVDWTLAHTDQHSKDLMRRLPFDLRVRVGDHDVHPVHGAPRKVNEYRFDDKPAKREAGLPEELAHKLLIAA